jgi:hypothetical protein
MQITKSKFLRTGLCCTDLPNFPWRNERDRRRAISARGFIVPFKHHSKGRRHIPRQRHRVTNWRDYDAALCNRGSLTVWFTEEALTGWRGNLARRRAISLMIRTSLERRARRVCRHPIATSRAGPLETTRPLQRKS